MSNTQIETHMTRLRLLLAEGYEAEYLMSLSVVEVRDLYEEECIDTNVVTITTTRTGHIITKRTA